jgi:DNA invertase Pin-like site-specific DNA recombinase
MKVGYARTSTEEQVAGLEAQVRDLEALGCEKVFKEQISALGERTKLAEMIAYVRDGDTVHVTKLDRLARSVKDMLDIVSRLRAKRATIVLPGIGTINGDDPTSELLLNVLAAIAQFERQIMLQRQRDGIAKAKSEGKYKGRAPTARAQADAVRRLADEGLTRAEIARRLPKISERSVYRILADARPPAAA